MQIHRPFIRSTGSLLKRHSFSSRARLCKAAPSSANPTELSHFGDLAASWWDPHGPSRLLHLMNPLRHDFISSCHAIAPTPFAKLRYLDIGCGGGIFAESAARLSTTATVTAIDPSPAVVAAARQHAATDPALHASSKLRYIETGIEALPRPTVPENGVDVLALWEVIEHVDHPADFLRSCMFHVKPGGWLVLSTIARTWPSWLVTKVVAEDLLRIVPRGTHEWTKYLQAAELKKFFGGEKGWAVEDRDVMIEGCMFVPGLGWKFVKGAEHWGNYFLGVRRSSLLA